MTLPLTAPRRAAAPARPARPPRPAPRPAGPDLRLVTPPRPDERGRLRWVVGVAGLVFLALFVAAAAHGLLVTGQARLDRLDRQQGVEQDRLERDRLELARLQAPERIADEARSLGMVPSAEQTWISPGTGAEPVTVGSTATAVADPTTDEATTDEATTEEATAPTVDEAAR